MYVYDGVNCQYVLTCFEQNAIGATATEKAQVSALAKVV